VHHQQTAIGIAWLCCVRFLPRSSSPLSSENTASLPSEDFRQSISIGLEVVPRRWSTEYALTRPESLARDSGLRRQFQRAAVPIMTNIKEGFQRTHLPEEAQFYNVTRASAGKVRSLLYAIADSFRALSADADGLRHGSPQATGIWPVNSTEKA
jgi:four helix bundle protein